MSDTPRTDAEECEIVPSANPEYDGPYKWVESRFARELERELNDRVSHETYENEFQRANENARKCIDLMAELADSGRLLASANHDAEALRKYADKLEAGIVGSVPPVGICIYCGFETGREVEDAAAQIIDHHKVCPQNPCRELERRVAELEAQIRELNPGLAPAEPDIARGEFHRPRG